MNKKIVLAVLISACLLLSIIGRFSISVKGSSDVAPDFTLTDIDGNVFSLSDYRGKVVLLDFFGTWCPACIQEIPHLKSLHEEFGEKLVIISISPEEEEVLRDFRDEYGIGWTIAKDTANVFDAYGIYAIPTLVIIDQEGYIRYTHVGLTDESILRSEIENLLPKTIYVDDDNTSGPWDGTKEHPCQNITSGIEHASVGDTIYVHNGTYNEGWQEIEIPVLGGKARIVVNKAVSIVGENRNSTVINGNGTTHAIVIMANGVNLTGFTIENAGYAGICLYYYTQQVTISGNRVRNDYRGILLTGDSGNNAIIENEIINNLASGIDLSRSSYNTICKNMIKDNHCSGIYVGLSSHNVIRANDIVNSTFGVALEEASFNSFYHNNFIDNEKTQVSGYNTWGNGYPSGGNYWSDYDGTDLYRGPYQDETGCDGIGDTPYVIDGNNQDNYPLMQPYHGPVRNLNTGQSYPTIQEGINNASQGDTIFTLSEVYYETVVVNKTVSLIGEDKVTTTIDGNMTDTVVLVTADDVMISEFTIRNGGNRYAGINLSSNGNNIANNIIQNNWRGISLDHYSAHNAIGNNNIMNNLNGISGELWSDSMVIGNTLKDNLLGIWIGPYSSHNTIAFNNIKNHWSEGISMWQSSYNTIYRNNITDNNQGGHWAGIVVGFSSHNQFFHNNIANKGKQIDVQGEAVNIWDDGYPSGGNYWSDYTGVDNYHGPNQDILGNDGIGDTEYAIDANNVDRYPLINPWTPIETSIKVMDKDYPVTILSDTTINQITATATTLHFKSSGPTGQKAYINVIFPMVNTTEIKVYIDDIELTPPPFPIINTNGTHYFIYFEFTLSTHNIAIHFAPLELVDVYTQKEPYSGKGLNQPSDAFAPQEEVQLYAYVSYHGDPVANKLVAFQVNDPTGETHLYRTNNTDENGVATISFRIPTTPTFGDWTVYATVDIAEQTVNDTLTFKVGWIIEITEVKTVDDYGNTKTTFTKDEHIYFNVTVQNIAFTSKETTLTIVVYDEVGVPIGQVTLQDWMIGPGRTEIFVIDLQIPSWAYVGVATVYTNAYTDTPQDGGTPYCPEAYATFMIKGT